MLGEDAGIDELHGDGVAVGMGGEVLPEDPLEPAGGGAGVVHGVLVVVDGELDDEKVDGTGSEHVLLESEGPGLGAGGSEPRIGDGELHAGKLRPEPVGDPLGMAAGILGDGAAEKGDMGFLVSRDLGEEVRHSASGFDGGFLLGDDGSEEEHGEESGKEGFHLGNRMGPVSRWDGTAGRQFFAVCANA